MTALTLPEICAHCRRAVDYETHSLADCTRNQELNRLHDRCIRQRRELRRLNAIMRERAALVAAAVTQGTVYERGRIAAVERERDGKAKRLLELMLELGDEPHWTDDDERLERARQRIREMKGNDNG